MTANEITTQPTTRLIETRDALATGLARWSPFPQRDLVQRRIDAARLAEVKAELWKRGVRS